MGAAEKIGKSGDYHESPGAREETLRARELDRAPGLQGTSPDGALGGPDSAASCSSRELRRGQRYKLHNDPTEFP